MQPRFRIPVALLVTILTMTVASQTAQGAVSAGKKCGPVGKQVVVGKTKYKCMLQGKSSRWVKRSNVIPVAPVAVAPTTQPLQTWEIAKGLLDAAWKQRDRSIASPFLVEYEPGLTVEPWVKSGVQAMEESASFFAALGAPLNPGVKVIIGRFEFISRRTEQLNCRRIGVGELTDNCAPGVIFVNVAPGSRNTDPESLLIHEAFHQAQTDAAISLGRDRYFYPNWLRQGGAELVRNYAWGQFSQRGYEYMRSRAMTYRNPGCEAFRTRNFIVQGRMANAPSECEYTGSFLAVEALLGLTNDVQALTSFVRIRDIDLLTETRQISPTFALPALTTESYQKALPRLYGRSAEEVEALLDAHVQKSIFG